MKNASYGRLTAGLIAAWFVVAVSTSALHLFKTDPNLPPVALGLAVLIPVVGFLVWFATSVGFRQFALSLNPRTLTLVHSWRIAGFTFLALYAAGMLPGVFALPAGWGDIAIGATARLAALKLANFSSRRIFILWQILGIADLITAVTLATVARLISPHGATTAVMTVLPMSLIPTFAVPLLMILHVICIAQARQWKQRTESRVGQHLPSSAYVAPRSLRQFVSEHAQSLGRDTKTDAKQVEETTVGIGGCSQERDPSTAWLILFENQPLRSG